MLQGETVSNFRLAGGIRPLVCVGLAVLSKGALNDLIARTSRERSARVEYCQFTSPARNTQQTNCIKGAAVGQIDDERSGHNGGELPPCVPVDYLSVFVEIGPGNDQREQGRMSGLVDYVRDVVVGVV